MSTFHPTSTIAWAWDAHADRRITKAMRSSVSWQWTADGFFRRTINPQNTTGPSWAWTVGTDSDAAPLVELLTGAGVTLKVYDKNDTDELLGVIGYEELAFETQLSGDGSGHIKGSKLKLPIDPVSGRPRTEILDDEYVFRVEVEGVERGAFIPTNSEDVTVAEDGTPGYELVGKGPGSILTRAAVAHQNLGQPSEQLQRLFVDASRAGAFLTLLDEAQTRGAVPEVVRDGWDAARDSNGTTWPDLNRLEFDAGGSLHDKLDEWGPISFEWVMTPRFRLKLATEFRRDLTDNVVLHAGYSVLAQSTERDFQSRANRLFAQDGNDGVSVIQDNASIAEGPVKELFVVFSDAVNEGTRTAAATALLASLKDVAVQRSVTVNPFAVGRRPWVDFDLGDVIGVKFDDVEAQLPFRVLAIALKATPDSVRCDVTLEFLLDAERRKRRALMTGTGGGAGGSSTPTLFASSPAVVADVFGVETCLLQFQAFRATYGKVGVDVTGSASTAMVVTVQLVKNSVTVIRSGSQTITGSGWVGISPVWVWPQIDEGIGTLSLRILTSTGTLTVAAEAAELWIEASGIGGQMTGNPNPIVFDTLAYSPSATDEAIYADPTWAGGGITEQADSVTYGAPPSDSIGDAPYVLDYSPAATGDDGYTTDLPSFSTGGTFSIVGNLGGVHYTTFYAVPLPPGLDLTGATVAEAYLIGVADQSTSGALTRVRAQVAASPSAPTDSADLASRTLTTASVDWDTSATAGSTYRSPDITAIVQEVIDAYGDLGSMLFVHDDRSSPLDSRLVFRTKDHSTGPPMRLWIRYAA